MKIKVFNELEIQEFKTYEKHIVISIQDPNRKFVVLPANPNRIDWVGLRFFDLDKDTGVFPYSQFIFNSVRANIILDVVKKNTDKINLICVNCVAGISRSAGVAGALSKILNGTDDFYFKNYIPNKLVYSILLKEYYDKKEQN